MGRIRDLVPELSTGVLPKEIYYPNAASYKSLPFSDSGGRGRSIFSCTKLVVVHNRFRRGTPPKLKALNVMEKMASWSVSVLVLALLAWLPTSRSFNYGDLSRNWDCQAEGRKLGNFPPFVTYKDPKSVKPLLSPPDQWTTFPIKVDTTALPIRALKGLHQYDDRHQIVSRPWPDPEEPMGFYIKPHGVGFANRIIFQLGLSEERPTTPPYPDSSVESFPANASTLVRFWGEYKLMWLLMRQGLFNCHVNRIHNTFYSRHPPDFPRVLRDEVFEAIRDVRSGRPHDWSRIPSRFSASQCDAGTRNPICCYAAFSEREYRHVGKLMNGEEQLYGRTSLCDDQWVYKDTERYRGELCVSDVSQMSESERILFHHSSPVGSCNKHHFLSLLSCKIRDTIKQAEAEAKADDPNYLFQEYEYVFPCRASCYRGMIIQIEMIPSQGQTTTTTTSSTTTPSPSVAPNRTDGIGLPDGIESISFPSVLFNPTDDGMSDGAGPMLIRQADAIPSPPLLGAEDAIDVTAVVVRLNRITQPPYNATNVPRYFGYEMETTPKSEEPWQRLEHLGARINLSQPFKFHSEEFTGIWIRWLERGSNYTKKHFGSGGPILQIGLEGSPEPLGQHDFSQDDMFIGNEVEKFGFKFGWRGIELQRPYIGSVFRPRFVTLNSPLLSDGFSYRTRGRECFVEQSALQRGVGILSKSTLLIFGGAGLALLGLGWMGQSLFRAQVKHKSKKGAQGA